MTSSSSSQSCNLENKHIEHLSAELGGDDGLALALKYGAKSLTTEQAKELNFKISSPTGNLQCTSGIYLPFQGDFAHLRCDQPPINRKGDYCKYLNRRGIAQDIKIFGETQPTIATEGWKDALRIHKETSETTVALPGVTKWELLPDSVHKLIYDADASINPYVWSPLVRAGHHRKGLLVAYFPSTVAGKKGGACEFFNQGGQWSDIEFTRSSHLLRQIHQQWSADLRVDFKRINLRQLIRCANQLWFPKIDIDLLLKQASKKLGLTKDQTFSIQSQYLQQQKKQQNHNYQPEPEDTYSRVKIFNNLIGPNWRADHDQANAWWCWTQTHWHNINGNDCLLAALWKCMNQLNWELRELKYINSDVAEFRRTIGTLDHAISANLIPFQNGVLDLEQQTLIQHQPEHGDRYCLPYAYDSNAQCPQIIAFLHDRLGDDDTVALFRAFCRGVLTQQRLKCFLEITGPSNTGKTVVTNLIQALIGRQNTTAGRLQLLEKSDSRFETYRYQGKRLAIFSESQNYSGPLETLKAFTGGDPIAAERKNSSANVDFVFTGGVIVTGNAPVKVTDTSGAVINRRRSILIDKVVSSSQELCLLDPDGMENWRGDLVAELPGFAAWILNMNPQEAKRALARDVCSIARAEAEMHTLLRSDPLARWAEEYLIWDENPSQFCPIGKISSPANDNYLFPHYRRVIEECEGGKPLGQSNFKRKLIDLLRDTLGLPLPEGDICRGQYRLRGIGSVIPHLCLRDEEDPQEIPGIIRNAFMRRINPNAEQRLLQQERRWNDQTPVGNKGNEGNEENDIERLEKKQTQNNQEDLGVDIDIEEGGQLIVPLVPPVPQRGLEGSNQVNQSDSLFPTDDDDPYLTPRSTT